MQKAKESVWGDLIVSMMAVNNYSLEKAFAHLHGLQQNGLLEPKNLISWKSEEIETQLKEAGFNRGSFMNRQMAQRMSSLGRFLETKGIAECESVLKSRDSSTIKILLLTVNGIGERVVESFFLLRGVGESTTPQG
ncbi:MAG: hypothetical protein ACJ71Q_08960 [Terriglobales bacterium]